MKNYGQIKEGLEDIFPVHDIKDPLKPEICRLSQGAITFKNVHFKYETEKNTPAVFNDFNLKVLAGQKVGLVGESGAGKSTFVNLLIRFMDIDKGQITIDEQNISSITHNSLSPFSKRKYCLRSSRRNRGRNHSGGSKRPCT